MTFGNKSEFIPLLNGKLKRAVTRLIPDVFTRFLTNRCRMGGFLVSKLEKPRDSAPS